ncbi:aryl-alcohol dehydrogenase [Fomitopsis serialis]|uniref:aryl-alcohol dehydrogenase n=1 Tax=Fomitopsis serialis TaxID=139415 RepID=UPI002007D069|nr:aryl-alcohol dehydrogenase [Neoantrodia serialis]KAH9931474.1 aryl-alcohol dehydrogenase [Neoantrodia serialis]
MSNAYQLWWAPPPPPATALGRHRPLAPLAGVHVSPICLGTMSLGTAWGPVTGTITKEETFKLLDGFYAAGGNFIDTSNNYHDEESEMFVGEWMEARGIREQIVVATKYTSNYKRGQKVGQMTHYAGNNMKSLHNSVEASLKKLRTDHIDILYVHFWDWTCGIEEIMNGLHNLVAAGKVLYLGISDTPAWIVAKANTYARCMGKTPFCIYQGLWNVMQRDFERDIIPMARAEGMAIAPWGVLASGKVRTDQEEEQRSRSGEGGRKDMHSDDWKRSPAQRKVCQALEKVAAEVGASNIRAVAIAYVMQKTPYVFPIIGGRKIEQLKDNVEALELALSPEQIAHIESVAPFDPGFPAIMCGDGSVYIPLQSSAGHFERWPVQQALRPSGTKTANGNGHA